jgi:hypothetical protein
MDVVTVEGRGSRTYLGPCGADDDDEEGGGDETLVIIEDASAAQTRRTIDTLDAAPRSVPSEMISALGLGR